MRKTLLTSLYCLSILGFAHGSTLFADEPKVDVASQIHGKWKVISVERSGAALPDDQIRNQHMVVDKESIRIIKDGKENGEPIKYKQDATKSPRRIELTKKSKVVTMEPGQVPKSEIRSEQFKALYEINGDTLTICFTTSPDSAWPESLIPKVRQGTEIVVLQRVK